MFNRGLLLAGGAISAVLGGAPALAQTDNAAPVATQNVDVIQVTGYRLSLENAIALRKNTPGLSDGIASDELGQIPDLDLAESLQRVTGVQVNRNNRNRTGTVTVRGLPETFSRVTVNGQTIVNPASSNNEGGGTGFPFGILDSDIVSAINVIKSPTPQYVEGGLSGIVDIQTRRPLESDDVTTFKAGLRYEETAQSYTPGLSGAVSRVFMDERLGVAGAFGYQDLDFRRDSVSVNGYSKDGDDIYRPKQVRQTTTQSEGHQFSASLDLQFEATPNLRFDFSGIYAQQSLDTSDNISRFETRNRSTITDLTAPTANGTVTGIRIENPRYRLSGRFAAEEWDVFALNHKTTFETENWTLAGYVNYSEGGSKRPFLFGNLQRGDVAGGNGITIEVDTAGGNLDQFYIDVLNDNPASLFAYFDQTQVLQSNGGTLRSAGAPSGWEYYGGNRNTTQDSDELSLGFDVTRQLTGLGMLSNIKFGAQHRNQNVDQLTLDTTLLGANINAIPNDILVTGRSLFGSDFFDGKIGADSGDFVAFDARRLNGYLTPVDRTGIREDAVYIDGLAALPIRDVTAQRTYNINNKYTSFYVQAGLEGVVGQFPIQGDFGVRYVDLQRDATFYTLDDAAFLETKFVPVAADRDFQFWLPSGYLTVDLSETLVLRLAGAKTIVPINPQDFQTTQSVTIDDITGNISVNLASANLPPFAANSFDIALEWYRREGSLYAVTVFQKDVDAEPVDIKTCPTDGGGLGFGPLTRNNTACYVGESEIEISISETGTQSYTLRGFELTAQERFDFLPAPFDNLGGQVNYTFVDVEGDQEIGGISKHTVNVIGYYEAERWGVRAAYNYRDDYFFASTSTIFGDDLMIDGRGQIDLSANYKVTDALSLSLEAFNITNAKLSEYEDVKERFRRSNLDGRTIQFSARYTF